VIKIEGTPIKVAVIPQAMATAMAPAVPKTILGHFRMSIPYVFRNVA
jgi:hypothetical protein